MRAVTRPGLTLTAAATVAAALVALALAIRHRAAPAAPPSSALPPLLLWAWERPEYLPRLDTSRVGVAFHAATLRLVGEQVVPSYRRQPLVTPPGTVRVPVVRVEVEARAPHRAALSAAQRAQVRSRVLELVRRYGAHAVQVDYDARASERPFYRALLDELRAELPPPFHLSMTALASWCLDDDWLRHLPVDEVVPMVFRMGADAPHVRLQLARRGDFSSPRCRQSVGLVVDEPAPRLPAGRRIWWFNPRSWTEQDLQAVLGEQQP